MAKYSANPAPFNHVTDAAPEYVDVILWHRVALVAVALVLALAGMGYGAFKLISSDDSGVSSPLAINEITQQEPPGAVAATSDESAAAATPTPTPTPQQTPAATPNEVTAPAAHTTGNDVQTAPKPANAEANTSQQPIASQATTATPAQPQQASNQPDNLVRTSILMPAVKRAVITDSVRGREPGTPITDTTTLSSRDDFDLHLFIDIHGRAGDTLTWTWKHNGKPSTSVRIRVGTNTWRGHASKHFTPKLAGDWQVEVTDQRDILLVRSEFNLGK